VDEVSSLAVEAADGGRPGRNGMVMLFNGVRAVSLLSAGARMRRGAGLLGAAVVLAGGARPVGGQAGRAAVVGYREGEGGVA
jgi:hypothetical protein